ncbi:hypothetical protein, partial [Pseudomonas sp.]|uniref:hypothetical protein n=1 Tax=Pseudomonas sp. TaxID=306 RepID=UPI002EDA69E7
AANSGVGQGPSVLRSTFTVGAGLLANTLDRSTSLQLTHRVRQQAGSYKGLRKAAKWSEL